MFDDEIEKLYKRIGLNVKRKREEFGMTQLQLAMAIGQKSTTIISQAELASNKHFNIKQLYKISKVLNCNICDLIR